MNQGDLCSFIKINALAYPEADIRLIETTLPPPIALNLRPLVHLRFLTTARVEGE